MVKIVYLPEYGEKQFQLLVRNGADFLSKTPDTDYSPLHLALDAAKSHNLHVWRGDHSSELNSQMKLECLLSLPGVDINGQTSEGLTPLMITAIKGDLRLVEILLSRGVSVFDVSHRTCVACIVLTRVPFPDSYALDFIRRRFILDRDFSVLRKSISPELADAMETWLHRAASGAKPLCVSYLLQHGWLVDAPLNNVTSWTAIEFANDSLRHVRNMITKDVEMATIIEASRMENTRTYIVYH
jgi:ankyrin repeat protein